jgi:hypothetical protein
MLFAYEYLGSRPTGRSAGKRFVERLLLKTVSVVTAGL